MPIAAKESNKIRSGTRMVFFLMGMIVFSSLSSAITQKILNFPIALPELLFLLFYVSFGKIIRAKFYLTKSALNLLLTWGLLISIGIYFNEMRFYGILSTARPYLYLIISYCLFSKVKEVNYENVYYVCLGSLVGWLFTAVYFFVYQFSIVTDEVSGVNGNMIAVAILMACSVLLKPKTTLPILLLVMVVYFSSTLRRLLVVIAVSLLGSLLFYIRISKIKTMVFLFALFIAGSFFLSNKDIVSDFLDQRTPLVKYRTITKIELLFSNPVGIEIQRTIFIRNFFDKIEDYILPRGFVSKQISRDPTLGEYIDFPFQEITYTLGLFGASILLLIILWELYKVCVREITNPSIEQEIIIVTTIICFILLFLEGTFISHAYITPFTGFVLGRLNYLSSKVRVKWPSP